MLIEKLAQKDLAEAKKMIKELFPYVAKTEKEIERHIRRHEIYVFSAVEKNTLLGFIDVELHENTGKINGLAVKEKFRKKGIGKKLLEFGKKFLQENGAEKIMLLVKVENTVAKKMYKTAGFEFARTHPKKIEGSMVEEMELKQKNNLQKIFDKMVT